MSVLVRRYMMPPLWKPVMLPMTSNPSPGMGELWPIRLYHVFTAAFGGGKSNRKVKSSMSTNRRRDKYMVAYACNVILFSRK